MGCPTSQLTMFIDVTSLSLHVASGPSPDVLKPEGTRVNVEKMVLYVVLSNDIKN